MLLFQDQDLHTTLILFSQIPRRKNSELHQNIVKSFKKLLIIDKINKTNKKQHKIIITHLTVIYHFS